jgi:glycerol-3-phosphate dehydrogenase
VLTQLQSGEEFDVLIIGGGATGAGAALDARLRGLKVACVEREDFACKFRSRRKGFDPICCRCFRLPVASNS